MTDPHTPQHSQSQTPPAAPAAEDHGWQYQAAPVPQVDDRPSMPAAAPSYQYHAAGQPQPPGFAAPSPGYPPPQAPLVKKQGAWGLWWLVVITFGIYYYVWYARINRELAVLLRQDVPADGQWWCQLIPIYSLVGLARTAKRVNTAHATVGSPTRVGVFTTWFWATGWFASQTRYLQRRINILHDVLASHSVH
jgi:hypothetical protein